MAGKQFSGIKYADGKLYQGATMILVPRQQEDLFLVSRLSDLLRGAGFRSVTVTTPEKHDEMIAFTSQLAHVVSNAYIKSPTAAEHLGFELDCLIRSLQEYRDAIAADDAKTLKQLLREGRERKEAIDTEWKDK